MSKTPKCQHDGCSEPQAKGSQKYCKTHKAESRARMKLIFEQSRKEREERDGMFALIWEAAVEGGKKVATDDGKPGRVVVRPANCAFANFIVRNGYGRKDAGEKGVVINVDDLEAGKVMAREIRDHDVARCIALG